jgi:hypothetical protein
MCLAMSTLYALDSSKKVDLRKIKAKIEEIALNKKSSVLDASYNKVLKPVLLYDKADELENEEGSNKGKESPNKAEELEDEEGSNNYRDLYINNNSREEVYGFKDMSKSKDKIKDEEMSNIKK